MFAKGLCSGAYMLLPMLGVSYFQFLARLNNVPGDTMRDLLVICTFATCVTGLGIAIHMLKCAAVDGRRRFLAGFVVSVVGVVFIFVRNGTEL